MAASVEVGASNVVVHFRLAAAPGQEDREDIEDIELDFNSFVGPTRIVGGPDETSSEVHIGPAPSPGLVLPGRLVFLREA